MQNTNQGVAVIDRKGKYSSRIEILATPPAFVASVRGDSRRNIAMPFGVEKLEWWGYPMVKIFEDTFIRFDRMYERDGRTDGRTDTA